MLRLAEFDRRVQRSHSRRGGEDRHWAKMLVCSSLRSRETRGLVALFGLWSFRNGFFSLPWPNVTKNRSHSLKQVRIRAHMLPPKPNCALDRSEFSLRRQADTPLPIPRQLLEMTPQCIRWQGKHWLVVGQCASRFTKALLCCCE